MNLIISIWPRRLHRAMESYASELIGSESKTVSYADDVRDNGSASASASAPPSQSDKKRKVQFSTSLNLGPASERDDIVWGSAGSRKLQKPDGSPNGNNLPVPNQTPRTPRTPRSAVRSWIQLVKSTYGIKRLLVVLTNEEVEQYEEDLLATYRKAFGEDRVHHVADLFMTRSQNVLQRILGYMNDAFDAKEKILVHCVSGQVRTACVLGVWLHHKYTMDVGSSVDRINNFAAENGLRRSASIQRVMRIIMPPEFGWSEIPSTVRGKLKRVYNSDDREKGKMHIVFIQTGGTIDKDYPRSSGGTHLSLAMNLLSLECSAFCSFVTFRTRC